MEDVTWDILKKEVARDAEAWRVLQGYRILIGLRISELERIKDVDTEHKGYGLGFVKGAIDELNRLKDDMDKDIDRLIKLTEED